MHGIAAAVVPAFGLTGRYGRLRTVRQCRLQSEQLLQLQDLSLQQADRSCCDFSAEFRGSGIHVCGGRGGGKGGPKAVASCGTCEAGDHAAMPEVQTSVAGLI